jgi:hypothetical protein
MRATSPSIANWKKIQTSGFTPFSAGLSVGVTTSFVMANRLH